VSLTLGAPVAGPVDWAAVLCAARGEIGGNHMETFGRAVAAAAVPALLSTIVTRVLMRLIALLANTDPHFDPAALPLIFAIYTLLLLPGCLALAYSRSRWPWLILGAGCAVLLLEAVAIGLTETSTAHDMTPARWVGMLAVLAAMLATFVAQAAMSAHWARRGLPWTRGSRRLVRGSCRPGDLRV